VRLRRLLTRACAASALLLVLLAAPAAAQLESPPPEKGGYCAPWHRCVAYAALGLAGISTVLFGLGYAVQSRGFDKLEHKQGNPEGVPVHKD